MLKCYTNWWKENALVHHPSSSRVQVGIHVGGCQVPGLKVAPVPVGSDDLKTNKHEFGIRTNVIRWRLVQKRKQR